MAGSSQKFIARNRAPRVQIEYDVELYGAEKKVQLPFVMGVMSDLAGKSEIDQGSVSDRKFLEIDVDNFDDRMRGIAPRAAFTVPNTLTGEGNMAIDLTFEKMSDFEPGAIASRVDSLRPLLEARQELSNLMTYMDGKAGAEALLEKVLADKALLGALAAAPGQHSDEQAQALDALRAVEVADVPEETNGTALDSLRAVEIPEEPVEDSSGAALDALRAVTIEEAPTDESGAALDALRAVKVDEIQPEDTSEAALDALKAIDVPEAEAPEDTTQALDALRAVEIAEETDTDTSAALDALRTAEIAAPEQAEDNTAALDALRNADVPEADVEDTAADVLASMPAVEVPQEEAVQADAILAGIEAVEVADAEDTSDAVLAGIEAVEIEEQSDNVAEALAGLEAPQEVAETDTADDVLAGLDVIEDVEEDDSADDILAGIDAVEDAEVEDTSASVLAGIEAVEDAEVEDASASVLAGIEAVEEVAAEDVADDVLAGLEAVEDEEPTDDVADALAGLEAPEEVEEDDGADDILAGIEAVEDAGVEDTSASVLAGIEAVEEVAAEDVADDVLAGLEAVEDEEPADDVADALAGLEAPEEVEEDDGADDILAGIEAVEDAEVEDTSASVLAGIEAVEEVAAVDVADDVLAGIEAVEDVIEADASASVLAGIEAVEEVAAEDVADDVLAGLEAVADEEEADSTEDVLAALDVIPVEEETDDDDLAATLAGLETPAEVEDGNGADDILAGLDDVAEVPEDNALDDALAGLEAPAVIQEADATADILADLEVPDAPEAGADDPADLDALLADIGGDDPVAAEDAELGDILADMSPEPVSADDDIDGLLGDLQTDEPKANETPDIAADSAADPIADDAGLDDLLADLEPTEAGGGDDLEALLGDLTTADDGDDLDDLLADLEPETAAAPPNAAEGFGALTDEPKAAGDDAGYSDDDLDGMLAGLGDSETDDGLDALLSGGEKLAQDTEADGLDELLAGLEDDPTPEDAEDEVRANSEPVEVAAPQESDDDLDALLAGLDDDGATAAVAADDDLDALLGGLESGDDLTDAAGETGTEPESAAATGEAAEAHLSEEPELAYGTMSGDRPSAQKLERRRFRIAILGDFTGRSAHGQIEVGDALANRTPILLDPDTVEDVIEGFATTLVLPIGKDGTGVEVKLGGLDDLHPDELYENVELFAALKGLKSQLSNGGTADSAAKSLVAWGEQHGRAVTPARAVSSGNTVRADLKLSDFQKLIGDTERTLAQPSPVDELMARVVGPHIRRLPDPNVTAMAKAVDEALSGAMRMVLHHPEFQSVESQWRALDLIARSIEVDDTLEVMLYDVSAEEIAADLTQADDLSNSGLARLLTEGPMDEEFGRGGYSALMGMYTFEETPPHAQLLGRIARVAAHVDAPFFAAITPGFIETALQDRHPLVAAEWDTLRAMPEAGHLALATPRFLMRRPYGAKTEPIYEFDFEEFTQSAGLSGMLWANPVVLVAILLARSFKENGPSMELGKIMSLGDMPFHFVLDRYGDQVALPCTERNLTLDKVETVLGRGYLPVVSIKGRDEIRLASFQSLAGGEILGPWSGVAPPPPSPPKPPQAASVASGTDDDDAATDDDDLDDLLSGFDLDADDSEEDIDNDEDMDAELAALLADL